MHMDNKLKAVGLRITFVASVVLSSGCGSPTLAKVGQPDLLAGMTFADSITDEDVAYLRDSLHWLYVYLPEWYDYVMQAKPLTLSVDLAAGEQGRLAKTKCCDEQGRGAITFGLHLKQLAASDNPDDQTRESRQIAFLSTLVHEATHIADRRAGRISQTIDVPTCIAGEGAAFAQELAFKRALVAEMSRHADWGGAWQLAAEKQIQVEASALNGEALKLYCVLVTLVGESE